MTQEKTGYLMATGYYLATAFSFFLVHSISQTMNPFLSIFWTFLITLLIFNGINGATLKQTYSTVLAQKTDTLLLNITTAGTWILGFLALHHLPAWLYAIITIGLSPSITFSLDLFDSLLQNKPISRQHTVREGLLLCVTTCLVIIAAIYTIQYSPLIQSDSLIIGCAEAFITACFAATYLILSGKFQKKTAFSTTQILSVRFYLTILVCLVVLIMQGHNALVTVDALSHVFVLAIFTSMIPLYFLQNCISNIGALRFSYFVPSILIITYLIDLSLGKQLWHWPMFAIICLLALLLMLALRSRTTQETLEKTPVVAQGK